MDCSFDLDIPPPAPPCSGCFEAVSVQFRLKCHHSLCHPCLQHSKTQDKVECPECQQISKMSEVEEMDATVNETLDESYLFSQDEADQSYSSMMSNVGYVTTECGGCKVVKMVTVKCIDCNKCMCAECKILHKQVLQNRSHTVECVEEIIRKVQVDLEDVSPQLEERDEALKLKLYEETRFIDDLKTIERKVIDEINSHRETIKRSVDSHHDDLISKVHELNEKVVSLSNERKDTINLNVEDIARCLRIINDLTTGMDFAYLLQEGRSAQQDIVGKIKGLDAQMNTLKEGTLPKMRVVTPKPWIGDQMGTSLETESSQRENIIPNAPLTNDAIQPKVKTSKVRRHQSLDSGTPKFIAPEDKGDPQVTTRLHRYESLDSLNSRRQPKRDPYDTEATLIKRNVNIQDIINRLQRCAEPKTHDTTPKDIPRRSQSFTNTTRPIIKSNLKMDGSPVVNKSNTPKRSQSFTSSAKSWKNDYQMPKRDIKTSLPARTLSNTDEGKLFPSDTMKPLLQIDTKTVPQTVNIQNSPSDKESTELKSVEREEVKNTSILPQRSQSYTPTNNRAARTLDRNRRLSDPYGLGLSSSTKSTESGINTWDSSTSISAVSETSMKSYSSMSDLSELDGRVTPRSGLCEPLNLSELNNSIQMDDNETKSADNKHGGNLMNGTSTPISNTQPAFPKEENKRDQQDVPSLRGPKTISSDQIRNMVNSMVSPRRAGGTPPPPGLKSVSLISPRRLNYPSGSRKSPLGTPRSYSTGVIHTITETDQDVETPTIGEPDNTLGKPKHLSRSLSFNTTSSTGYDTDRQKAHDISEVNGTAAETEEPIVGHKTVNGMNDGMVDKVKEQTACQPETQSKPKGILKQSKIDNNGDKEQNTNITYREVRTETEEIIEKPRHTIHSPRITQQIPKFDKSKASPLDAAKINNISNHAKPKKLALTMPDTSDTENEDTSTETIKNSPRFMDLYKQLNGDQVGEPVPSDLKSPRRVHVLKSQVKFVEKEKQKMKAHKALKTNNGRMLNGTPGHQLSKTLPSKLPSHQHSFGIAAKDQVKVLPAVNGQTGTNGLSHAPSDNTNGCENDFTKMEETSYIIEGLSQLPFRPYRVYMIDSTLWCSALSGLHIYDVNCKFVRSIKHPDLRHCRAIVKTAPNEIVVGCADKYGLLALDINGEYKSQIMGGCFPDVNFYQQQLLAFEFNRNEILVFGLDKNGWQGKRTINLNYGYNRSLHDIMHIQQDGTMYFSCWNENCILRFNPGGTLVNSYGQYGQGDSAGRLYDPRVCKVDVHGNALVADYWNQRMQVCTQSGEWFIVEIAGDLGLALDAVVDTGLKTLWVIARDNKLMKFVVTA